MIKYLLLAMALVITLPFWLPTSIGGDTSYHFVLTDSMKGSLDPGSFVILRASDSYNVGEAVGYKLDVANGESVTILHRIIGREDDGTYILKGDAVESTEQVKEEAITGRTVLAVPALGFLPGAFRAAPMLIGGLLLTLVFLSGSAKKKDVKTDSQKAQPRQVLARKSIIKRGFSSGRPVTVAALPGHGSESGSNTSGGAQKVQEDDPKGENLFIPAALVVLMALPFATATLADVLPSIVVSNMMGSLISGVPLFMLLIGVLAVTRMGEMFWIRGPGGGLVAEVNYGVVMILAVSFIPMAQLVESTRAVFSF